jgi:hypothetical protein
MVGFDGSFLTTYAGGTGSPTTPAYSSFYTGLSFPYLLKQENKFYGLSNDTANTIVPLSGNFTLPLNETNVIDMSYSSSSKKYVAIGTSGKMYYYDTLTAIPRSCQYDSSLLASIQPTGSAKSLRILGGAVYAFGSFVGNDNTSRYGAILSTDGMRWRAVSNSKMMSGGSFFRTGVNTATGSLILGGCQALLHEGRSCSVSCNSATLCANQQTNFVTNESDSTIVIDTIWPMRSGYVASMSSASDYGFAYSADGQSWRIIYLRSQGQFNIGGIVLTPITRFKFSVTMNKLFVAVQGNGTNYLMHAEDIDVDSFDKVVWSSIEIDPINGVPYDILVPSPNILTTLCGGKSCGVGYSCKNQVCVPDDETSNKSAAQQIWEDYKNIIIGAAATFGLLLLSWIVSLLKLGRQLHAQVPQAPPQ